jgi:hypothetical protein
METIQISKISHITSWRDVPPISSSPDGVLHLLLNFNHKFTNEIATWIRTASNPKHFSEVSTLPNSALWRDGRSSRICKYAFRNVWKRAGETTLESKESPASVEYP